MRAGETTSCCMPFESGVVGLARLCDDMMDHYGCCLHIEVSGVVLIIVQIPVMVMTWGRVWYHGALSFRHWLKRTVRAY